MPIPKVQVEFLKSCAGTGDLPNGDIAEIAVLGRSNVGKSSLLNSLAGKHQLAKVSRTPGRTRLLNYFSVHGLSKRKRLEPDVYLVDCPGYGYAKVARDLWEEWGAMVQPFLSDRPQLKLCLLLVDANLPAQPMDLDLHAWLRRQQRETLLVATKWDRLSGNGRAVASRKLQEAFGDRPLGYSSHAGIGREQVWKAIAVAATRSARTS